MNREETLKEVYRIILHTDDVPPIAKAREGDYIYGLADSTQPKGNLIQIFTELPIYIGRATEDIQQGDSVVIIKQT